MEGCGLTFDAKRAKAKNGAILDPFIRHFQKRDKKHYQDKEETRQEGPACACLPAYRSTKRDGAKIKGKKGPIGCYKGPQKGGKKMPTTHTGGESTAARKKRKRLNDSRRPSVVEKRGGQETKNHETKENLKKGRGAACCLSSEDSRGSLISKGRGGEVTSRKTTGE